MKANELQKMVSEMIALQQQKLQEVGESIMPNLTSDDLLQPQDIPALENDPRFRYEEGMLAGMLSVQAGIQFMVSNSQE